MDLIFLTLPLPLTVKFVLHIVTCRSSCWVHRKASINWRPVTMHCTICTYINTQQRKKMLGFSSILIPLHYKETDLCLASMFVG